MKYFNFILIFSIALSMETNNTYNDKLLFCLKSNIEPLSITKENNRLNTNLENLNIILEKYTILQLEPWLNGATEDDNDGDIYLNRIYRIITTSDAKNILIDIKNDLEKLNEIHSVEFEYKRKPLYTPNDQYYNNQWFLPDINSNDAWDFWNIDNGETPGNRDVILASVDLGVFYQHPDLRDNLWQNLGEDADGDGRTIEGSGSNWYLDPGDLNGIDDDDWDDNPNTFIDDLVGWDSSGNGGVDDNNPDPPHNNAWSHGTHVAGLLASTTDNNTGIASTAFNCSIMAVKVADENQSGQLYITDGFAGILYAAKAGYYAEGFTIINNSWGGIGYSQYEQATINVCYNDYNSIIVCAGGNGNNGQEYAIQYPSGYENVIAVAPLGSNNQWNHWGTYHETIDLSSPGENIRSTTCNGYASWDGSSMASPIAASVFGLLKSLHPTWNNHMLETMVLGTADPIIYDILQNNEGYLQGMLGTGRVDSYYAITTPLFPKIEHVGEDIVSGNDQLIQPGEQCELFIILFNNPEWGAAINVQATIETDNPYITIINPTINYGDMNPGEAMIVEPYVLEFDINTPPGNFDLNLNIISNENGHVKYHNDIMLSYTIEENLVNLGDLNQDSVISILDIVLLVNIVLGNTSASNYELMAGDINQDNILNILDIIALVNLILD